ncbi:MAG: hypothetical protein C9356_01125 [Oleiphilus sp.]|nr:MAG: hypothetical protein C9356_01125 [Oleiphilus sp.]
MANIIVCADGTWNRPEEDASDYPTNILKLARAIAPTSGATPQHVFYDWGLGSYHNMILGGATGKGIEKNIMDGYRYIVQNYDEGDHVYLFGFSRGAYTVRALSGMINNCGLLKREHAHRIPEAWKLYKSKLKKAHPRGEKSVRFRQEFSHPSRKVRFVGVWDTVGALGIPRSIIGFFSEQDEFYDTELGSNVAIARHALAIDEKRTDFEPTLWDAKEGLDLKQVWFAGVHSDIGGSYGPDKHRKLASDTPLAWMLDEAEAAGLAIEPHVRDGLRESPTARINKSRKHIYRFSKALHRPLETEVQKHSRIHPSVKARYHSDPKYRPPMLKKWVDRVGWDNIDVGT